MGGALEYDDLNAAAGIITAGTATASAGTFDTHVALTLAGTATQDGAASAYRVRARNALGNGAASSQATGYRGIGAPTIQWERSDADADASYAALSSATSATHDDADAPASGEGRYYRAVVSADGAQTATSNAVRGFRASPPWPPRTFRTPRRPSTAASTPWAPRTRRPTASATARARTRPTASPA